MPRAATAGGGRGPRALASGATGAVPQRWVDDRYNIIAEQETAAAFKAADLYLSLQPTERNVNVTPMAAAVGGR